VFFDFDLSVVWYKWGLGMGWRRREWE